MASVPLSPANRYNSFISAQVSLIGMLMLPICEIAALVGSVSIMRMELDSPCRFQRYSELFAIYKYLPSYLITSASSTPQTCVLVPEKDSCPSVRLPILASGVETDLPGSLMGAAAAGVAAGMGTAVAVGIAVTCPGSIGSTILASAIVTFRRSPFLRCRASSCSVAGLSTLASIPVRCSLSYSSKVVGVTAGGGEVGTGGHGVGIDVGVDVGVDVEMGVEMGVGDDWVITMWVGF